MIAQTKEMLLLKIISIRKEMNRNTILHRMIAKTLLKMPKFKQRIVGLLEVQKLRIETIRLANLHLAILDNQEIRAYKDIILKRLDNRRLKKAVPAEMRATHEEVFARGVSTMEGKKIRVQGCTSPSKMPPSGLLQHFQRELLD